MVIIKRSFYQLVLLTFFVGSPAAIALVHPGGFSIDLSTNEPIIINKTFGGTMENVVSGARGNWLKFKTTLRFNLPAGVTLGGVINGTVTSTNMLRSETHSANFSIDMSLLSGAWGDEAMPALIWPGSIGVGEEFRFTDVIVLNGTVTVTNTNTYPVEVTGRTFKFTAHGYNAWEVPISGTVPARSICTLTVSQPSITLGDITEGQITSSAAGARLEGMSGAVTVFTQCNVVEAATLQVKTTLPVIDNCVEADNQAMNFCVETAGNKMNVNGDGVIINGSDLNSGHSTELNIYAVKGSSPGIGESKAVLSVVASPN
jgi:hypothetical protein